VERTWDCRLLTLLPEKWKLVSYTWRQQGFFNNTSIALTFHHVGITVLTKAFGSTHTINPLSTSTGFCDDPENSQNRKDEGISDHSHRLACLDDITSDIDLSTVSRDPWKNFPALKAFLKDRVDWNIGKPMIDVEVEHCHGKGKNTRCEQKEILHIGPKDVESGNVFHQFNKLWFEEGDPLLIKRDQLENSFWTSGPPNILNHTWE
jgi:hypothetical protein